MPTRSIARTAMLAAFLFVCFTSFSLILYLEVITIMIVLTALVFPKREALLAILVFTILNMTIQGITIWSLLYVVVYLSYGLFVSTFKKYLLGHEYRVMAIVGIFAFSTGMILDLPFFLFSKELTYLYLILGLQTSIIQAVLGCLQVLVFYKPLVKVFQRVERGI